MKWFKKNGSQNSRISAAIVPVRRLFVSDYLSERAIHFFSSDTPKEEILFKLVSGLSVPEHGLALSAILEREKMGSTIIDSAISIPHARIKGLRSIELAIGICANAAKGEPRLFFLFLSPKEDTKIHLLFLSSLSSLFQSEGFLDNILASKAPHEVAQKIRQIEKGI